MTNIQSLVLNLPIVVRDEEGSSEFMVDKNKATTPHGVKENLLWWLFQLVHRSLEYPMNGVLLHVEF